MKERAGQRSQNEAEVYQNVVDHHHTSIQSKKSRRGALKMSQVEELLRVVTRLSGNVEKSLEAIEEMRREMKTVNDRSEDMRRELETVKDRLDQHDKRFQDFSDVQQHLLRVQQQPSTHVTNTGTVYGNVSSNNKESNNVTNYAGQITFVLDTDDHADLAQQAPPARMHSRPRKRKATEEPVRKLTSITLYSFFSLLAL